VWKCQKLLTFRGILLAPSAAADGILKRKFITENSKEVFCLSKGDSSLSETCGTSHRFDTARCPDGWIFSAVKHVYQGWPAL